MTAIIDVLIPTYRRPTALAVTLTSLCAQTADFRLIVADQTEDTQPLSVPEVQAVLRVLQVHGHAIALHPHRPRRGLAEQRQFLLDQATAPYVLYLDNDLILEPDVINRLLTAIQEERCGFVGCSMIGLSFRHDCRPHEQAIEFWEGPVQPETVKPDSTAWERFRLHNAANLYHVQQRLTPGQQHKYRLAWAAGCVLYDTAKLRDVGGFSFWRDLPQEHCGEDVLAQLRVMARYGGCGLIPSGVYHQELPTTVPNRSVDAPQVLFKP